MFKRDQQNSHPMTIQLYRRYLSAVEATPWDGQMMPYEWGQLPKSLNIGWAAYGLMFDEFSLEIANSVNQFSGYVHRLKAWSIVISSMTDEHELMDAVHQFIEPIATVSLTLPYVIRSRFIFAAAHLCHQANQSLEGTAWKDDLPLDHEILFPVADAYGRNWPSYTACKSLLERISDKKFQRDTHDFRHSYNHRFSPHVVVGMSQIVTRQVDPESKKVSYAFGGIPPLKLNVVADLLTEQCKRCYAAHEAFQQLVREHEVSISACQLRQ
jgi:hypothetical protein